MKERQREGKNGPKKWTNKIKDHLSIKKLSFNII